MYANNQRLYIGMITHTEDGEETISLQLGMYANNQRLYISMITHTEDGAEPFADMTVNLPGYSLDPGEAFISGDISKMCIRDRDQCKVQYPHGFPIVPNHIPNHVDISWRSCF